MPAREIITPLTLRRAMFHLRHIGPGSKSDGLICLKKTVTIVGRRRDEVDHVICSHNYKMNAIVSRRHCRLKLAEGAIEVLDDSRNGVFVNDVKIDGRAVITEGDVVTMGHPFGEKLQPGTRARQPDSEYQYILERCYCSEAKHDELESDTVQNHLSSAAVGNQMSRDKQPMTESVKTSAQSVSERLLSSFSTFKQLKSTSPTHKQCLSTSSVASAECDRANNVQIMEEDNVRLADTQAASQTETSASLLKSGLPSDHADGSTTSVVLGKSAEMEVEKRSPVPCRSEFHVEGNALSGLGTTLSSASHSEASVTVASLVEPRRKHAIEESCVLLPQVDVSMEENLPVPAVSNEEDTKLSGANEKHDYAETAGENSVLLCTAGEKNRAVHVISDLKLSGPNSSVKVPDLVSGEISVSPVKAESLPTKLASSHDLPIEPEKVVSEDDSISRDAFTSEEINILSSPSPSKASVQSNPLTPGQNTLKKSETQPAQNSISAPGKLHLNSPTDVAPLEPEDSELVEKNPCEQSKMGGLMMTQSRIPVRESELSSEICHLTRARSGVVKLDDLHSPCLDKLNNSHEPTTPDSLTDPNIVQSVCSVGRECALQTADLLQECHNSVQESDVSVISNPSECKVVTVTPLFSPSKSERAANLVSGELSVSPVKEESLPTNLAKSHDLPVEPEKVMTEDGNALRDVFTSEEIRIISSPSQSEASVQSNSMMPRQNTMKELVSETQPAQSSISTPAKLSLSVEKSQIFATSLKPHKEDATPLEFENPGLSLVGKNHCGQSQMEGLMKESPMLAESQVPVQESELSSERCHSTPTSSEPFRVVDLHSPCQNVLGTEGHVTDSDPLKRGSCSLSQPEVVMNNSHEPTMQDSLTDPNIVQSCQPVCSVGREYALQTADLLQESHNSVKESDVSVDNIQSESKVLTPTPVFPPSKPERAVEDNTVPKNKSEHFLPQQLHITGKDVSDTAVDAVMKKTIGSSPHLEAVKNLVSGSPSENGEERNPVHGRIVHAAVPKDSVLFHHKVGPSELEIDELCGGTNLECVCRLDNTKPSHPGGVARHPLDKQHFKEDCRPVCSQNLTSEIVRGVDNLSDLTCGKLVNNKDDKYCQKDVLYSNTKTIFSTCPLLEQTPKQQVGLKKRPHSCEPPSRRKRCQLACNLASLSLSPGLRALYPLSPGPQFSYVDSVLNGTMTSQELSETEEHQFSDAESSCTVDSNGDGHHTSEDGIDQLSSSWDGASAQDRIIDKKQNALKLFETPTCQNNPVEHAGLDDQMIPSDSKLHTQPIDLDSLEGEQSLSLYLDLSPSCDTSVEDSCNSVPEKRQKLALEPSRGVSQKLGVLTEKYVCAQCGLIMSMSDKENHYHQNTDAAHDPGENDGDYFTVEDDGEWDGSGGDEASTNEGPFMPCSKRRKVTFTDNECQAGHEVPGDEHPVCPSADGQQLTMGTNFWLSKMKLTNARLQDMYDVRAKLAKASNSTPLNEQENKRNGQISYSENNSGIATQAEGQMHHQVNEGSRRDDCMEVTGQCANPVHDHVVLNCSESVFNLSKSPATGSTDSLNSSQRATDSTDSVNNSQIAMGSTDSLNNSQLAASLKSSQMTGSSTDNLSSSSTATGSTDSLSSSQTVVDSTDSMNSSQLAAGLNSNQTTGGSTNSLNYSEAAAGLNDGQTAVELDSSQTSVGLNNGQAAVGLNKSREAAGLNNSQAAVGSNTSQVTAGFSNSQAAAGFNNSQTYVTRKSERHAELYTSDSQEGQPHAVTHITSINKDQTQADIRDISSQNDQPHTGTCKTESMTSHTETLCNADREPDESDMCVDPTDFLLSQTDTQTCAVDSQSNNSDAHGRSTDVQPSQTDTQTCLVDSQSDKLDSCTSPIDIQLSQTDTQTCAVDSQSNNLDSHGSPTDIRLSQTDTQTCAVDSQSNNLDSHGSPADIRSSQTDTQTCNGTCAVDSQSSEWDTRVTSQESEVLFSHVERKVVRAKQLGVCIDKSEVSDSEDEYSTGYDCKSDAGSGTDVAESALQQEELFRRPAVSERTEWNARLQDCDADRSSPVLTDFDAGAGQVDGGGAPSDDPSAQTLTDEADFDADTVAERASTQAPEGRDGVVDEDDAKSLASTVDSASLYLDCVRSDGHLPADQREGRSTEAGDWPDAADAASVGSSADSFSLYVEPTQEGREPSADDDRCGVVFSQMSEDDDVDVRPSIADILRLLRDGPGQERPADADGRRRSENEDDALSSAVVLEDDDAGSRPSPSGLPPCSNADSDVDSEVFSPLPLDRSSRRDERPEDVNPDLPSADGYESDSKENVATDVINKPDREDGDKLSSERNIQGTANPNKRSSCNEDDFKRSRGVLTNVPLPE